MIQLLQMPLKLLMMKKQASLICLILTVLICLILRQSRLFQLELEKSLPKRLWGLMSLLLWILILCLTMLEIPMIFQTVFLLVGLILVLILLLMEKTVMIFLSLMMKKIRTENIADVKKIQKKQKGRRLFA